MSNAENLLTSGEAARLLAISTAWLNVLAKRGKIRSTVTRLGRLYHPGEVERVRKARAQRGAPRV